MGPGAITGFMLAAAGLAAAALGFLMRHLPWWAAALPAFGSFSVGVHLLAIAPDAGLAGIGLAVIALCAALPASAGFIAGYAFGRFCGAPVKDRRQVGKPR